MGFFDRLSRLVRANANAALNMAEDPVKILDQSVADMQADLVQQMLRRLGGARIPTAGDAPPPTPAAP